MIRSLYLLGCIMLIISNADIYAQIEQKQDVQEVTIGIVIDGPWEGNDPILNMFLKEISDLLSGEFETNIQEENIITSDWTVDAIQNAVRTLLDDPDIDVLLTLGVIASHEVSLYENLQKPVIAPFVLDAQVQDMPYSDGTSGVSNLNYLTTPEKLIRDIQALGEIVDLEHLTFIVTGALFEHSPQMENNILNIATNLNIELSLVKVTGDADAALTSIPDNTDAVLIGHILSLPEIEYDKFISGIIEKKLPSFSIIGRMDVESGILATITTETLIPRRARRVALNLQRILLGENAGDIPVNISIDEKFIVNMATARTINIYPGFNVLTEAELLNPIRKAVSRNLTLESVIFESIEVNLDLLSRQKSVQSNFQNIALTRSNLLPHIDLSAENRIIDKDRAQSSLGSQPERLTVGSATISQILFSDKIWSQYGIQKNIHNSIQQEYEQLKLDITLETASAYLNLMRARALETIERDNLNATRQNLDFARVRQSLGVSGPAEVYRWESQIALQRNAAINTNTMRNVAEIELNRILNRPLEESFTTEEVDINDPALLKNNQRLNEFFKNPWDFDILRDFMVLEGLKTSPELKAIDAALAAREQQYVSTKRAYWSPTLALQGNISNIFSRQGAGASSSSSIPPEFSGVFPDPEDFSWSLGLNLSFPLIEGGAKIARLSQSREEFDQLQIERQAVVNVIEQRIRTALHLSGASNANITLSRAGAESAHQNFELVRDAYLQGVVSIVDLIDAQNNAFVSDQRAASAIYDFLLDYYNVQRAIGVLDIFRSPQDTEDFLNRLDQFAQAYER